MTDKLFFQYAIQIFESYVFKKAPDNMEVYKDSFWVAANEKINEALNQNPKIILLLKLVYIDDKITENILLNLLFSTICKTKSLRDKIIQKPDEWGGRLIWPFYDSSLIKVEDWASPSAIKKMIKSLDLKKLTRQFNKMSKNETFKAFPKTYKSIAYYLEK